MVSPETAERVREAAEELGYRVNRVARGLKMRRSLTIGMLIPDITNPFFPGMVRGAEDRLHESGYTLVLADTDNDPARDRLHRDVMLERQVDGLLLATSRRRDPVIDELAASDVPFVLVNRTVDRGRVAAVIPDDHAGTALAVDHLYDLGHRVIGQVSGPPLTTSGSRRAAGFVAAVRALGLEPGASAEASAFTIDAGREAAGAVFGCRSPAHRHRRRQRPHRGRRARRGGGARALLSGRLLPRRVQRHGVRGAAPSPAHDGADRRIRAGPARGTPAPVADR